MSPQHFQDFSGDDNLHGIEHYTEEDEEIEEDDDDDEDEEEILDED